MDEVRVRQYLPSDAEVITRIINQDKYNFQYGLTAQEFDRDLDEPGEKIRENTFVVILQEQIIGYISLSFSESADRITVYSYSGVDMDWRRRGVGTRILQFIFQHLQDMAANEERKVVFVHRADSRVAGLTQLAHQHGMLPGHELLILQHTRMDQIAVRPLVGYSFESPQHSDAASWAAIYNEAFGGHKTTESVIHEWNRSDFNPDFYILASSADGEPVAFISSLLVGDTGKIPTLAVRPGHQGRGLGQALLTEALTRLRRAGAKEAALNVGVDNKKAIALYSKLGFDAHASRCNYYKEILPADSVG